MAQTTHSTVPATTAPPKDKGEVSPLSRRLLTWSAWGILAIALLFSLYVRGRLREFPLERDEGEFAYAGQLILQGIPPYQLAYNMKLPGTYLVYAGLMAVFGQSISGIHLGLLAVNLATIVLLFLMVRDMFDSFSAAVAALAYSLMSVSPSVLGMAAHATHFVAFFGLAGTWLLWRTVQSGNAVVAFRSGTLLAVAFLMKQQGVFLLCFGGLMVLLYSLWLKRLSWRRAIAVCGLYGLGGILPYAATCLWLWHAGVFGTFWFWTVDYASKYLEQIPLSIAPQVFWLNIRQSTVWYWPVLLLALGGVVAALFGRKEKAGRPWFVLAFLFFSFLCVCPGFLFRSHYFIVLLPAVALLAGVGAGALMRLAIPSGVPAQDAKVAMTRVSVTPKLGRQNRVKGKKAPLAPASPPMAWRGFLAFPIAVGLLCCMVYPVWQQADFCFSWTPQQACRLTYGANPFLECPVIAEYLKQHTQPDETVAVIGSEPEVYFYAKRKSATGHIYTYGLMEVQPFAAEMQREMITEIEAAKPAFMLFVNVQTSWLPRPGSNMNILHWAEDYLRKSYQPVGVADIVYDQAGIYLGTQYKWDDDVRGYQIHSPCFVTVWKRKS